MDSDQQGEADFLSKGNSGRRDGQMVNQLTGLAKSRDPRYVKFTTYVPRQTHLRVKSLLVGEGRELSDLVSELLEDWLSRQLTV